ncbi:MAG TPA: hypothetical protein DCP92_09280 [Nitrospiraceae bacterium]|jgi:hypothetical protein|nr:hypothetical protein [Nitrospiraceae bacterium]
MKKALPIILMVIAISFCTASIAFASAMDSARRVDMILVQSTEQETNQETEQGAPLDQGTPQEEIGSGQSTGQDAGPAQGTCTGAADCPDQNEAMPPDKN